MIATDLYESRVVSESNPIDRVDPVIYGPQNGVLSHEELTFFNQNGYLFFDGFLNGSELDDAQKSQQELRDNVADTDDSQVIFELDGQHKKIRSIFNIHRNDPVFKRVSKNPRIVQMVEQLLGSKAYIHQSRINYKPAFRGKEFYWHSDFETWHTEDGMPRMRAVSCSITLTENTPFNGSLMIIPGSHRVFIPCVGQTPDDHFKSSLRKQDYGIPDDKSLKALVDTYGIVSPVGKAGSLVLFDCNVMHGSNSNISPTPRTNLFYVYNSIENTLQKPFGGTVPRPDYIASRTAVPIDYE